MRMATRKCIYTVLYVVRFPVRVVLLPSRSPFPQKRLHDLPLPPSGLLSLILIHLKLSVVEPEPHTHGANVRPVPL